MSWQFPVDSGEGEDVNAFLDTLIDFDTSYIEAPKSSNSENDREYGHRTKDNAETNDTQVLTIMASISTIHRHLETERKKGNARPSVAIKLKDLNEQKSITFSIPVLHSPTTTTASSMSSRSSTPTRSASPEDSLPEAFPLGEAHTARTNIATLSQDTAAVPQKLALTDGCVWPLSEGALPSTLPILEMPYSGQAMGSPPRSLTPGATATSSSALLDVNTAQHRRGADLTHAVAISGEIGREMSPYMTTSMADHSQQAADVFQLLQASAVAPSKEISNAAVGNSERERSRGRENIFSESQSSGIIKRPRLETLKLETLLHNTDKLERVKELTVGQDSTLVYKMVRNARAILPESAMETLLHSTPTNNDATNNISRHSRSLQEDVMRQFCNTVRQIEWAETLTFRSMVQYRILFVQLYQHYLSFQKILDTKKGERRVTVAKERLYTMLYPDKAKKSGNGCMSAEWEKFNRCIRRGKQWYTIASELGIGILHRMPPSIRHTWVEQKLQTKTQLYLWIEIIKLLV